MSSKPKILLVDDDAGLRRIVAITLGEDEFELLYAGDGNEALATARNAHPDLILLDVSMPGLNGFEVARQIKRDQNLRNTKIIMLTAAASPTDRQQGQEAGVDDYFVKPFSPLALLEKVHSILGV